MTDETAAYALARTQLAAPQAPPARTIGAIEWLRRNLFNSWFNTLLTIACLYLLWLVVPPLVRCLFIDAVWDGAGRADCLEETVGRPVGACWPFIRAKFTQLVYGFYPWDQQWRVDLTFLIGAVLLVPLLIPRVPYKALNAGLFFGAYPIIAYFLLVGGRLPAFGLGAVAGLLDLLFRAVYGMSGIPLLGPVFVAIAWLIAFASYPIRAPIAFITEQPHGLWYDLIGTAAIVIVALWLLRRRGERVRAVAWAVAIFAATAVVIKLIGLDEGRLPYVETRAWGGLLVTLVVAVTGIVASLPLGIMLALGRRSRLPIVRFFSVVFIEFWRGVPLITVLFFATYMLPLFLPNSWTIDSLLRALVGVALFAAAYMAEVVRGGLQAIPRGQYEAAMALGFGYWRMTGLIILPQALRLVIPGIVNTFIGLFKDTTLVLIVAIFDLLGMLRAAFADPNWSTPVTLFTGFAFTGFIYFFFCFGMSRYSLFVEKRLSTPYRR
jgi:general L-amino acid transport system permease protein